MRSLEETGADNWSKAPLSKLWIVICISLATLLLAWPSFVNRGPFFITDTTAYLRSADAAFSSMLRYDSIWSDKRELYEADDHQGNPTQTQPPTVVMPAHPPLIGRSIYYGAFIYAPVLLIGEHAGILIQAALSAIVIWLALVPIGWARRGSQLRAYFVAIGLLALTTSLPFTATVLVPDYLTGLACGALVMSLCFWDAYSRWEIAILAGVIALAALSHSSNLPLLLAISLFGLIARVKLRLSAKAALIGLGAVMLGFAGDALFVFAVTQKTGMTPIRPPFLTARLISDGPGHKLLRARCSAQAFEVCRYTARTPHDSDLFLWSVGTDGVFSVADFPSQSRLSQQDIRFAAATFREYPLLTIASSSEAFARQLALFDLTLWQGSATGDPIYDLANLPVPVAGRMARTLSVRGAMPIQPFETIMRVITFASLLVAIWCLVHAWRSDDKHTRKFGVALALIMLAIVANAAITGGLSKPDARYNLRVIWLLPFFIFLYTYATCGAARLFASAKID